MTEKADPREIGILSDEELLRKFLSDADEAVFHQIVERYVGMVFSVALRRCGNRGLAEEATQNTFTILARKARNLKSGVVLGGWLYRVVWIEASEMMRRESRRKQAMQDFAENANLNERGADSLGDALEVLDEAIAELPTSERDLLILRFHGGLRLHQIATRMGITEEASRKRVDRALNQLARLLVRKGVVVPVTALAASLTDALASMAPSGLALAVTHKALAATASSEIFTLITLMSQTKATISGLAMVFVLGTASFLTGRHHAIEFGRVAIRQSISELAAATPNVAIAPPRPAVSVTKPVPARSARAILEEAIQVIRDSDGSSDAYWRALLILRQLSPRDIPEAVAFLQSVREAKLLNMIAPIFAGIWAETDGPAAAAWAEERLKESGGRPTEAYGRVLTGWARHQPGEAYAWYLGKAAAGVEGAPITSFRWLPTKIFSAWAMQDPWAAALVLENVSVEDERAAILGICEARERSADPTPLLSAVHAMPDSKIKARLVEDLAKHWARESPEAAAAWIDSVPLPDVMSRFRARAEVAEEWFRKDRGALWQAGAWLLAGAPNAMRQEILQVLARVASRSREQPQAE